jgi:hypothetical protein
LGLWSYGRKIWFFGAFGILAGFEFGLGFFGGFWMARAFFCWLGEVGLFLLIRKRAVGLLGNILGVLGYVGLEL